MTVKLPIEVVQGTYPPRFRWRQLLDTVGGAQVVDHDGYLPATVDTAVASLVGTAEQLAAERDKLQAFKVWVHAYLDEHAVPHHPPGEHGAEGCRIGDRLDWLFAQLEELREQVKTADMAEEAAELAARGLSRQETPAPKPAAPAPVAAVPSRRGGRA